MTWREVNWLEIVVVSLLLMACSDKRGPDVFIKALHPIDGNAAVVIYEDGNRQRIARIDATGRARWSRVLPGAPLTIAPYNAMAIVGDTVVVRYGHRVDYVATDHALAGFSLRDGRLLWDTVLSLYHPGPNGSTARPDIPSFASSLPIGDGHVAQWANDGVLTRLYSVEAATGAILSQQLTTDDFRFPYALGDRVVVNRGENTTIFDMTGKETAHELPTWFAGCVIGDEFLTFELRGYDVALVALRGADPAAKRVVVERFHPFGHPDSTPQLRRCGRYRDRLVLLITMSLDGRADERTFVVITDANGQMLHSIDLGRDMQLDGYGVANEYPHAASLSGELTRFVPYVQTTFEMRGDGVKRFLMLDLEQGAIAWAGPNDESLSQLSLFRVGERWYTFVVPLGWTLTVFDGRTGQLAAATRLHAYHGIGEIRPYHVSGDRIWVYAGARGPIGAASIALLDAATLTPIFSRGVKTTDVTAEVRAGLGLK